MLMAWYVIRGERPISPRTRTLTETFGSWLALSVGSPVACGGEWRIYRDGAHRRRMVKHVDARTVRVRRRSRRAILDCVTGWHVS
jgi:hypothetical protein